MSMKFNIVWQAILISGVALLVAGCQAMPERTAQFVDGTAKVVTADTIQVNGHNIRMHGILAPSDQLAATYGLATLAELVDGERVGCTERWTDATGILVAECSITSKERQASTSLNTLLLRSGAALLRQSDFAARHEEIWADYRTAEFVAQRRCIGVWKAAMVPPFSDYPVYRLAEPGC